MSTMNFSVLSGRAIREWPRIEDYQNSTLRYTPPKDFAGYWVDFMGHKPKIIRTWVTLDEIWDIDTDTYNWNYQIGVDKLGDKRYYIYDWDVTRPSETHFEDYLTSYCVLGEEAMLNIRRFERETADGLLSYEKYEEVCEKVIEHCCNLCPNIVYIEVSNESEISHFGNLAVKDYMKIYDCLCRVVKRLNAKNGWTLKVGGTAMTGSRSIRGMWHEFMQALAEDTCPDKQVDFYSFHSYNADSNCLQQLYNIHKSDVAKYNLPDAPLFFDEYGTRGCSPKPFEGLMNACGVLVGMMRASDLPGMYVFPWCTFHNPVLQMSYTQFLNFVEGGYAPTPNAMAAKMLFGMLKDEVMVESGCRYETRKGAPAPACEVDTYLDYRVRATREGNQLYVVVANPSDETLNVNASLCELNGTKAEAVIRQVDRKLNNCIENPNPVSGKQVRVLNNEAVVYADPSVRALNVTDYRELNIENGVATLSCELPPYGFASWTITVK